MSSTNFQITVTADENKMRMTCSEHGNLLCEFLIGNATIRENDFSNVLQAHLKKKHREDSDGH